MSKEKRATPPMTDNAGDIATLRRLLNRLPRYLANGWRDVSQGAGYFGDGSSGENGIRSNTNLVFALAVLLTDDPGDDLSEADRARLTAMLGQLVRYLGASHVTGTGRCADGRQWGLNWQSSWWASKLALGAGIARDLLDPADFTTVCTLVAAEADRHLDRLIPTGLSHDTKAEETAWDAEILAVALGMLPENAHAPRWRQRLIEFGINTFSCPSDRDNTAVIDGMPVRDALRSCNIHEDGTLENHGTTHFCYVASPLLSKTWCAYALRRAQQQEPAALGHNVARVWDFAEPTFLENRFAYLGGQDWARYTYGEYFILPALPYLASLSCGARTGTIFRRRLGLLDMEAAGNTDGSFFGSRFTEGLYTGQFAKYETDCFACIALALEMLCRQGFDPGPTETAPRDRILASPEALCCYARSADRFVSFAWSTLTRPLPNVTFVPLADDSLAEWHEGNLLGAVFFGRPVSWVGVKAMETRDTGFKVESTHSIRGLWGGELAEHQLSLDLKDGILHILSRYTARRKLRAVHVTGLNWRLPNDLFNGFSRQYFCQGPDAAVARFESQAPRQRPAAPLSRLERLRKKARFYGETTPLGVSRWLNVDDRIGVVMPTAQAFTLRRYPRKESTWNSLNVEQLEAPGAQWQFNVPADTVLLETHCLLHLGSHEDTRRLAEGD